VAVEVRLSPWSGHHKRDLNLFNFKFFVQMEGNNMSFNLTTEKWIPVVTQDWKKSEVSLIELFDTWTTLREIQAENPPTTLAIHRFLLAILHRAYQGPRDVDHWEEIQEDNGQKVIEYLKDKADFFDLFHLECPFMQDKALSKEMANSIYTLSLMQADNTSTVFVHEHQWSGHTISLSESARLLIRLQSVDPTSLRAFYPNQKSGNRSAVNTPTINAANILIQGVTLKGTLLFNLMQYNPESELPSPVTGEDLPTWEIGYEGKPKQTVPSGYINYLTYPWRRLRLFTDGQRVGEVVITMGNSLPDKIPFEQWECGVAFKDNKPVRLSLEAQLWRNAHSFLHSAEKEARPRIIDWLAELRAEELVEETIHLQIFGLCADKAKPLGWGIEKFSAPALYITDAELGTILKLAILCAKDHQNVFRSFRGSPYYALAEGLNPDSTGGDAIRKQAEQLASSLDGESRYWLTLDREFIQLLNALPQDEQTSADGITCYGINELPKWTKTVQKAARDAFTASIQPIRNYEARAKALRTLDDQLRKLRGEGSEKSEKPKKSSPKS
jgi:CRISPR system Cascade subunit CasA